MPNLLGATPESDVADFTKMWGDHAANGGLCPDEIKIYPTQLLEDTELYTIWQRGEYSPYNEQQLVQLLADVKVTIPRYCRVNRVIRDIPSTHVVEGNRRTSLRQDAILEMTKRGTTCQCLRCREVKGGNVDIETLQLDDLVYHPIELQGESTTTEHFLSFVTPEDRVAGYLRLSIPLTTDPRRDQALSDLHEAAIIREIHVYGQSLAVGKDQTGAAQHVGLGTRLIAEAVRITRENHLKRLAVISAVGTRVYYRSRGFSDGDLYQWMDV
jgi:elongator complex protein 3